MSHQKRKDKTKGILTNSLLSDSTADSTEGAIGESLLLLVEGKTEKAYFDGLRSNKWLNGSLSGVTARVSDNFSSAIQFIRKEGKTYPSISIVTDNDKRNAFVLVDNEIPFWRQPNDLPEKIINNLNDAFDDEKHRYFLSVFDYLQWLNDAIGAENIVNYWDKIQFLTPIKSREFAPYKDGINIDGKDISLAYTCISFEFWLVLHFQQNKTPFIWVEKEKGENIDVFTFLQTICPSYKKGENSICNAYTCLYEDFTKQTQTIEDDWLIIYKIIQACENEKWLQNEMKPILERQSGKWFEVNPYVKGFDVLMTKLLNLKRCNTVIDYSDLKLEFTFIAPNQIKILINAQETFILNQNHIENFIVKSRLHDFRPSFENYQYSIENPTLTLTYNTFEDSEDFLVLVFKDPRNKSRSRQLLVLLEN